MNATSFGWSYPPGCSGPPEGDSICEVCGGDCETDAPVGGCICEFLIPITKPDFKDFGNAKELDDRTLAQLQERFSCSAANLLSEQKRRYALKPIVCSICKKPMAFEEFTSEECNAHGACRVLEEDEMEKEMEKRGLC